MIIPSFFHFCIIKYPYVVVQLIHCWYFQTRAYFLIPSSLIMFTMCSCCELSCWEEFLEEFYMVITLFETYLCFVFSSFPFLSLWLLNFQKLHICFHSFCSAKAHSKYEECFCALSWYVYVRETGSVRYTPSFSKL